jgi:hypothetical protein
MRDRAWRRDKNNNITIRKIKNFSYGKSYYRYADSAGYGVQCPFWGDYIGTKTQFTIKSIGNPWRYTGEGLKYSPNKSIRGRSHRWGRPGNTPDTREFNKRILIRIKQEYGLK